MTDKQAPGCNSVRRRPRLADSEIYFRIIHLALDGRNVIAEYTEHTVEFALGPKGAFENGNIGTLTRRVPADRVVSAIPPPRGKPKPPKVPRPPRVAELLRKAIEWQALLESSDTANHADIARREQNHQHILSMPEMVGRPAFSERPLRPIAQLENHKEQRGVFSALLDPQVASASKTP